jgi:hypothetical protein
MLRPRWHDALIALAILAVLVTGVWALWWDDVRSAWHHEAPTVEPVKPGAGQA